MYSVHLFIQVLFTHISLTILNNSYYYHDQYNHNPQWKDGEGNPISAMHDIPMLSSEGVYNMVVEVRNNCNLYEYEQE